MLPATLEAIIFDMDGTLLDTEILYREVEFAACRLLGREMTDALHLSLIGRAQEHNHATLLDHFGPEFPVETFFAHCRDGMDEHCRGGTPVKQGAIELLAYLKELGIPRAVATAASRKHAIQHLTQAGLIDYLDAVVTRSDVVHGKPHPETFLKAAALLNAIPANCVAVEDSYNGIRAAHAAGMATIMVPDLLPPTGEIRGLCAGVVEGLGQVHEHVRMRHRRQLPATD